MAYEVKNRWRSYRTTDENAAIRYLTGSQLNNRMNARLSLGRSASSAANRVFRNRTFSCQQTSAVWSFSTKPEQQYTGQRIADDGAAGHAVSMANLDSLALERLAC
jgi:hypothetical protein